MTFTMGSPPPVENLPVVNIADRLRKSAQRMPYKRAVVCPAGRASTLSG